VIGTDYTGSCKSNYQTITTTMALIKLDPQDSAKYPDALSLCALNSVGRLGKRTANVD
jgi:hypothetical protein